VAAVTASLDQPRFKVRWSRSVGRGTLFISGRVSKASLIRLDLRRPRGGPLLTLQLAIGAGRFRQAPGLVPGVLAGGAHLFPGGFTVALTGRSGTSRLPLQVRSVVLPAPREGVTRRAFTSTGLGGVPAKVVAASGKEAWANYLFEAQPKPGQRLSVRWFEPNGTLLGAVDKSNRPSVTSFLRAAAGSGLPPGDWRAELRAGGRVVSLLLVRIR
jgi:hypothetical protein